MITRFDHAVIAVRDLDSAIQQYAAMGFDVRPGGRHTGRGTHNALIRFGLDYLELLAIYDVAEARAAGQSGLADFLERRPGGLIGFAVATDDIEGDAERFRQAGVPLLGPFGMQRMRPDGNLLSWRLLVPYGDVWLRPWPFLIQWDQPDAQRLTWESVERHPNDARAVAGVTLAARDVEGTAGLLRNAFGLPLDVETNTVQLGAQMLALTPADRTGYEGVTELAIAVDNLGADLVLKALR